MDTRVKPPYDERIFSGIWFASRSVVAIGVGARVPDILQRVSKTEPLHNTAFMGRRNATAIRNAMIEEISQNRA
jgi:hypothetical protein